MPERPAGEPVNMQACIEKGMSFSSKTERLTPMKKHPHSRPAGFTLIELLTVIAIIGVLAAILIPAIGKVRQKAGTAETVSNLRQIYGGMQLYANEHSQELPIPQKNGEIWSLNVLFPYMNPEINTPQWTQLEGTIFTSPNAPAIGEKDNEAGVVATSAGNQGFGMNTHLGSFEDTSGQENYGGDKPPHLSRIRELPRTMLLMDSNSPILIGQGHFLIQFTTYVANRHNNQNAVLFGDGHVEMVAHERFTGAGADSLMPFNAPVGTEASLFWRGF
jgi:general secretion pathway protein G